MENPRELRAPPSWRNWQAKREGCPPIAIDELQLFSDAWFIDEALGYGPYSFFNPVPRTRPGQQFEWKPAIVLRAERHLPIEIGDMRVTDDEHYHGGTLHDEVAALLSVLFGVRVIAGPVNRQFGHQRDPLGSPSSHSASLLPILPVQTESPQIPSLFMTHRLSDIELLNIFPQLNGDAAVALVKSCRLYQQALWICDTTPELSWLLLVSAIETAAGYWNASVIGPVDRLRLSYPKLFRVLIDGSGENLLEKVAAELQHLIAATGKFIGFTTTFSPDPPSNRPEQYACFNFEPSAYKDAMSRIYGYRSRALHGGVPFPFPMCRPPRAIDATGAVEERPFGLGAGALGATWIAEDLPMLLHVFAHITRGTLINWWRSMAQGAASSPSIPAVGSPP